METLARLEVPSSGSASSKPSGRSVDTTVRARLHKLPQTAKELLGLRDEQHCFCEMLLFKGSVKHEQILA